MGTFKATAIEVDMHFIKTFAVYALAMLSGLIFLRALSDLLKFNVASLLEDTVTSLGRLAGTVLLLAISAGGLSLSLQWIRKQRKPH